MIDREISTALASETIFSKSKIYISRAFASKSRGDFTEYQLWASLALELLGKSVLADIHPCLVADPQSSVSLFAAASVKIGTDIKTITAKTLYERFTHLSKRFDKKTQDFCQNMSLKRNAELHSGEIPFDGIIPTAWEGRYWHTAQIILDVSEKTIEEWLGANQSKAPKDLLEEYVHALSEAAKVRVETSAEEFSKLSKSRREALLANAQKLESWGVYRNFDLSSDEIWATQCPACKSKSFLAGIKYSEEVSDDYDPEYPGEETVDVFLVAEEFWCPSCNLRFDRRDELEAVGFDVEHTKTEIRQREYEPDYGND